MACLPDVNVLIALPDAQHVDAGRILATDQVTDTYLLALARAHRAARSPD